MNIKSLSHKTGIMAKTLALWQCYVRPHILLATGRVETNQNYCNTWQLQQVRTPWPIFISCTYIYQFNWLTRSEYCWRNRIYFSVWIYEQI